MESRKLRNTIVHLFALNGCEIPDRRMDSFAIVEKLDIFKNLTLRFLAGLEPGFDSKPLKVGTLLGAMDN